MLEGKIFFLKILIFRFMNFFGVLRQENVIKAARNRVGSMLEQLFRRNWMIRLLEVKLKKIKFCSKQFKGLTNKHIELKESVQEYWHDSIITRGNKVRESNFEEVYLVFLENYRIHHFEKVKEVLRFNKLKMLKSTKNGARMHSYTPKNPSFFKVDIIFLNGFMQKKVFGKLIIKKKKVFVTRVPSQSGLNNVKIFMPV